MKKFIKLSIASTLLVGAGLSAGEILKQEELTSLVQKNITLNKTNIKVKKAEKISENLTTLKIGILYNTKRGIQEKPGQAFIANIDGQKYTFLGVGEDSKGESIYLTPTEDEIKSIKEGTLWTMGTGPEKLYLVTNPSCPWCQKFEEAVHQNKSFLEKYTVSAMIMPFNPYATEKTYWILNGATSEERADRYKELMVKNNVDWQNFKPSITQKMAFDAEIKKSLNAASTLEATGTPAVFNSKYQKIENWGQLFR